MRRPTRAKTTIPTALLTATLAASAWAQSPSTQPTTAPASATEMVANPNYAGWARFKPGSSNTMTSTIASPQGTATVTTVSTLVSVSATEAVVEATTSLESAGQGKRPLPVQRHTIPARVPKANAYLPPNIEGTAVEAGTETLQLAGKPYLCRVLRIEGRMATQPVSGKTYYSDDVPGGAVKIDMTIGTPGGPASSVSGQVTAIEVK